MADEWDQPRSWVEPHDAPEPGWQWAPPPNAASVGPAPWTPAPGSPAPGPSAPRSGPGRSRRPVGIVIAAVLVVVLVVVLVNVFRSDSGGSSSDTAQPPASQSSQPGLGGGTAPSPSTGPSGGDSGGSGGSTVPVVSCPSIRDEESHLSYTCIENALEQGDPDPLLGLRIALSEETEPGWIISEGSGNPKSIVNPNAGTDVRFDASGAPIAALPAPAAGPVAAPAARPVATPAATDTAVPGAADVQAAVRARAALAVAQAYGDSPTAATVEAKARDFGGVAGYELQVLVTIDPDYRVQRSLKVKTERLWVIGLPTAAGVSIFMLSIPDERKDLWPKAEATVGSIRVI
jgi:hypothetical protein